eukprot:SM000057S18348  [mRNA]  locus=s57:178151:180092:+ [translate_table: standard]
MVGLAGAALDPAPQLQRLTSNLVAIQGGYRFEDSSTSPVMPSGWQRREATAGPAGAAAAEQGQEASEVLVESLIADITAGNLEEKRNAAAELRKLARFSTENRERISAAGAVPLLISLLSSNDGLAVENAVTALLNLSINDSNKYKIAAAGAIDTLVLVLSTGTSTARENAAATLFSLALLDENKVAIGEAGAIGPLVDMLSHGTPRGKKDAATALFNLSIHPANKLQIIQAQAVPPLVNLMLDVQSGLVDKAVAVLSNLATVPRGREAIGAEEHGISGLVDVVEAGSQRGKENAAAALLQLANNSPAHCAAVLRSGPIPALVALTQSGTPRAREKANILLGIFREQRQASLGR